MTEPMALRCPHCQSEAVAWSDNYCGMCGYRLKPGLVITTGEQLTPAVAAELKAAMGLHWIRVAHAHDIEVLP